MNIKILALGDVVGPGGVALLRKNLWKYRFDNGITLCVANGENASPGNGLDAADAAELLDCGIDVLTTGNHVWQKKSLRTVLETSERIVRPANYPSLCPGSGYTFVSQDGIRYLIANAAGVFFSDPLDSPFEAVERILTYEDGNFDIAILDIHAETTSEKAAIARYFDGRIQVIFGTHTHVPTADERILPRGSGFITDLGMTGPVDSILGVKSECIIEKLRTKMPVKFETAEGICEAQGAVFTLDSETKKVISVERTTIK